MNWIVMVKHILKVKLVERKLQIQKMIRIKIRKRKKVLVDLLAMMTINQALPY